jgi:hypothetical protein
LKLALLAILIVFTVSSFLLSVENVDAHSPGPVIVHPQVYYMEPGQTLTQDMRICLLAGDHFVVNNISFTGNHSTWVKVDGELPVTASAVQDGASGIDVPITVTVPPNFSERIAVPQAVVEVKTENQQLQKTSGIPIFIRNATVTQSNLPDCNSYRDIMRALLYSSIILIVVGGALVGLGYFAYRRSKRRSNENKAIIAAKIGSIILIVISSLLLMLGIFLLIVQPLWMAFI